MSWNCDLHLAVFYMVARRLFTFKQLLTEQIHIEDFLSRGSTRMYAQEFEQMLEPRISYQITHTWPCANSWLQPADLLMHLSDLRVTFMCSKRTTTLVDGQNTYSTPFLSEITLLLAVYEHGFVDVQYMLIPCPSRNTLKHYFEYAT